MKQINVVRSSEQNGFYRQHIAAGLTEVVKQRGRGNVFRPRVGAVMKMILLTPVAGKSFPIQVQRLNILGPIPAQDSHVFTVSAARGRGDMHLENQTSHGEIS